MSRNGSKQSAKVHHLHPKSPTLDAYIKRVDAVEKNFRRFVVEIKVEGKTGKGNYRKEVAVIKIGADNIVRCDNKELAPKEDEVKQIKSELDASPYKFPHSITAGGIEKLLDELGLKPNDDSLFICPSQNRKGVDFIQQRVIAKNGDKIYVPWSLFSDGEWRKMEPDHIDGLPFWKPKKDRLKSRVMVHEGAKAAQFIDDLVNNPERKKELAEYPWRDDLIDCEHWGWLGGAPNPHRTNWLLLRDVNHVTVVCDNDDAGKAAARPIAKALSGPAEFLIFSDKRFPSAFDLADDFPLVMFVTVNDRKVYRGPGFKDCLVSGTWATKKVKVPNPDGGKEKSTYVLRAVFVSEWKFANEPPMYFNVKRGTLFTEETFNRSVRPFSDVPDTAARLGTHPEAQVSGVTYNPGLRPGLVTTEGKSQINVYQPPTIKAVKGDAKPWTDFMTILIPIEKERAEMYRIIATLIARPDVRIPFGVLLMSETQGVGKSTLMEKVLAPLVGWPNTSSPGESEIADGNYNGWAVKKRLVLVHEIYSGQSKKAYNRLKSIMSEDVTRISEKYEKGYELPIWCFIMASSNSPRALYMAAQDRRWFIPMVTEDRKEKTYWTEFNQWLSNDGLGIIKAWAEKYLLDANHGPVMPGELPMATATKDTLIEDTMSEGKQWVRLLAQNVIKKGKKDDQLYGVRLDKVRESLARNFGMNVDNRKLESNITITSEMKRAGLQISKQQFASERIAGQQRLFRVAANFKIDEEWKLADIKDYLQEPEEFDD